MRTWIVVADKTSARFFSRKAPRGALSLVKILENPQAKLRNRDLDTDKPGRRGATVGESRSALSTEQSSREKLVELFIKRVARELELGAARGDFDKIALVLEPHLLGLLRSELPPHLLRRVALTLDKDLNHVPEQQLVTHLEKAS